MSLGDNLLPIARKIYESSHEKFSTCFPHSYIYSSLWEKSERILEVGDDKIASGLVEVSSISKFFTFLACAYAEKIGLLNIEDSISVYVPTLRLFFQGVNRAHEITIQMLLRHTSGLPQFGKVGNVFSYSNSLQDHIFSLDGTNIVFLPGEDTCYSNLNYDLLGWILTIIYRKPFPVLMHRYVFSPLGIEDAVYTTENASQNPSSGLSISIPSLIKAFLVFTGGHWDRFLSRRVKESFARYTPLIEGQKSGMGLCCRIFGLNGHDICSVTGQFIDQYCFVSWAPGLPLLHISVLQRIRNGQIQKFHEWDPFWLLLSHVFHDEEDAVVQQMFEAVPCSGREGRYISCDSQIIEITVCEVGYTVSMNHQEVGIMQPLSQDTYRCNDFLFRFCSRHQSFGIQFVGAAVCTFFIKDKADAETLSRILPYYKYRIKLHDKACEKERLHAALFSRYQDVYIAWNDQVMLLNGSLPFYRERDMYVSAGGAWATIDGTNVTLNNLEFERISHDASALPPHSTIRHGRI